MCIFRHAAIAGPTVHARDTGLIILAYSGYTLDTWHERALCNGLVAPVYGSTVGSFFAAIDAVTEGAIQSAGRAIQGDVPGLVELAS